MITLAICNNKGGTGKTTTARHLAIALAGTNQTVGLLDLDDQANLTRSFCDTWPDFCPTMAQVLRKRHPAKLIDVLEADWTGDIVVAPAGDDLADVADDMVAVPFGVLRLRQAIEQYRNSSSRLDWLIIDCPPNLGSLTYSALIAADAILIPTQCAEWALAGVDRVLDKVCAPDGVNYVRSQLGSAPLMVAGVLACLYDQRVGEQERHLARLQSGHNLALLGIIPRREGADAETHLRQAYAGVAQTLTERIHQLTNGRK